MRFLKKSFVWAIVYGTILTAFTSYVVLDAFVIPRTYVSAVNQTISKNVTAAKEKTETADAAKDTETADAAKASGETKENTSENKVESKDNNAPGETPKANKSFNGVESKDNNVPGKAKESVPENSEPKQNNTATNEASSNNTSLAKAENTTENQSSKAAAPSTSSYKDDNISINLTESNEYNTNIYAADIKLSDAKYLKTALANNSYGKNITAKTSETAQSNNAILAINGDFYGARASSYVVRNGVVYREDSSNKGQQDLVIWNNGSFSIVTEGATSAKALVQEGAQQVLSFGPGILSDGKITVTENGKQPRNPRTAIGICDDLHYVMIVCDGRTGESAGLTLYQLAEFMQKLGVKTAYNLDGGGSSAMYFNGKIVNKPTADGKVIKERSVSDIVYIGN